VGTKEKKAFFFMKKKKSRLNFAGLLFVPGFMRDKSERFEGVLSC
jgi:hypothetical protein